MTTQLNQDQNDGDTYNDIESFEIEAASDTALHKKRSFPLRIYPVNVTKSEISWRNFLEKSLMENFIFCAVLVPMKVSVKQ